MKATNLFCLTAAAILATGCTRPQAMRAPATDDEDLALERSKEGVHVLVTGWIKFVPYDKARFELRGQKLLVFGRAEVEKPRGDLGRFPKWAAVVDVPSQAVEFAAIDAPLGASPEDQVAHYLARPAEEQKPLADMFKYLIATHQRPLTGADARRDGEPVNTVAMRRSFTAMSWLLGPTAFPRGDLHFQARGEKLVVSGDAVVTTGADQLQRHHWGTIYDPRSDAVEMVTVDSPWGGTAEEQIERRLGEPLAEQQRLAAVLKKQLASPDERH